MPISFSPILFAFVFYHHFFPLFGPDFRFLAGFYLLKVPPASAIPFLFAPLAAF